MLSRKKMIPPKQIQYHVFHWPNWSELALITDGPCVWRRVSTGGGILEYAVSDFEYGWIFARSGAAFLSTVSCTAYGVSLLSCGATAMTPSIAFELAELVFSIPRPFAPPPPAAIALLRRGAGIVAGLVD